MIWTCNVCKKQFDVPKEKFKDGQAYGERIRCCPFCNEEDMHLTDSPFKKI